MHEHKFVSFIGLTGCGKTTAADILKQDFDFRDVPEEFANNPFLADFYHDMKRWAFHSQLFFLLRKIEQMEMINTLLHLSHVVQDFPIYQDIIYANVHRTLNNLSTGEWDLYQSVLQLVEHKIVVPDLLVFLNVSPKITRQRIAQRGRKAERSISLDYLTTLYQAILSWLTTSATMPVLEINGERLNLATNQDDIALFKEMISDKLRLT
jgi:deoxyadenosine/deoxycytidine kinase